MVGSVVADVVDAGGAGGDVDSDGDDDVVVVEGVAAAGVAGGA